MAIGTTPKTLFTSDRLPLTHTPLARMDTLSLPGVPREEMTVDEGSMLPP